MYETSERCIFHRLFVESSSCHDYESLGQGVSVEWRNRKSSVQTVEREKDNERIMYDSVVIYLGSQCN